MGRYTSVTAFLCFLVLQFLQGIILNNFLRRETRDLDQWWWLVVDAAVLVFWILLLLARRGNLITQDMPVVPLPTMAIAWAIYLAVVFIPRLTWTMVAAGTCLGQGEDDVNSTSFEAQFSVVSNLTTWEGNGMTTTLALGSTVMLLALAFAGYGQHGLVNTENALDFDMAEAAFSMMDGVEFLGVFWEDDVQEACPIPATVCNTTGIANTDTRDLNSYICALEGSFGLFIITVTVFCFILPFFALWQFKRRSGVLKAEDVVKDSERRMSVSSLNISAERDLTKRLSTCSLTSEDSLLPDDARLSVYHQDFVISDRNKRTLTFLEKEVAILKALYILWDLFMVNLCGAIIRFYLWIVYNRSISALITKNVLAVIFRCLNVTNDYIIPFYRAHSSSSGFMDVENGTTSTQDVKMISLNKMALRGGTLPRVRSKVATILESPSETAVANDLLDTEATIIANAATVEEGEESQQPAVTTSEEGSSGAKPPDSPADPTSEAPVVDKENNNTDIDNTEGTTDAALGSSSGSGSKEEDDAVSMDSPADPPVDLATRSFAPAVGKELTGDTETPADPLAALAPRSPDPGVGKKGTTGSPGDLAPDASDSVVGEGDHDDNATQTDTDSPAALAPGLSADGTGGHDHVAAHTDMSREETTLTIQVDTSSSSC